MHYIKCGLNSSLLT